MKVAKIIGIIFLIVGLLFAALGTVKYVVSSMATDDRIYTTARIVRIDARETGDPEIPIKYTAFVEFDADGEKVCAQLNTYKSSFKTGKQVDVYYFSDDLKTVYETGSNIFYIIFAKVGLLFAILGAVLTFKNVMLKEYSYRIFHKFDLSNRT